MVYLVRIEILFYASQLDSRRGVSDERANEKEDRIPNVLRFDQCYQLCVYFWISLIGRFKDVSITSILLSIKKNRTMSLKIICKKKNYQPNIHIMYL